MIYLICGLIFFTLDYAATIMANKPYDKREFLFGVLGGALWFLAVPALIIMYIYEKQKA